MEALVLSKRDFYFVLGVAPLATPDVIRKAYRALSKQYHPDRNPAADAEERMKELVEAYSHLNDREKRKLYDGQPQFRLRPAPRDREPVKVESSTKRLSLWEKLWSRTQPARKNDPKQVELHFTLGLSLAANESMTEQAREEFGIALELDARYREARYNYAVLCYRLGEFEEARSAFEEVLVLHSADRQAQLMVRLLS